jgi:transposase-like protein
VIIQNAVWLYLRFTLSFRDVQDLLAERSIFVSRETIRRWVVHFGPIYARRLRAMRPTPTGRWHLEKSSSQLPVDRCICGALSTMKVRSLTFSFKPSATRMQRYA